MSQNIEETGSVMRQESGLEHNTKKAGHRRVMTCFVHVSNQLFYYYEVIRIYETCRHGEEIRMTSSR